MKTPSAIPLVHVYVARVPFEVDSAEIIPSERKEEIASCSNEQVRRAKFYVWKLLEDALMRSFALQIKDVPFSRTASGKWECSECCLSLSHSKDLVAVALSRGAVGVDVELKNEARFTGALAQKVCTEREENALAMLNESDRASALNVLWTKKEALFKCTGEGAFIPRNLETSGAKFATREIADGDRRYLLTVASEDAASALFRLAEGLQIIE